jgi:predicted lipoprotein with Yx(FWY)xxD motif
MRKGPKKTMFAFALLAVIGAVVIAGCGGGSSSTSAESGSGEGGTVTASNGGGATVGVAEIEGLGPVLVDSEGMTLYDFTVDKGTTSECYEGCEAAWPPLIAKGKPTAGEGAMASALGTTKRKDGTLQVTYNGHPLYTFAEDQAPGEVKGNEFEGTWFVLDKSGEEVMGQPSGGEAEEESSGGGGY